MSHPSQSGALGVIFDMDGVLVQSYRPHYESWRITTERNGVSLTEADFAGTFGRTSREIIPHLWPGRFTDEQVARFDADKEAAYRQILREHFPEMPGASDLIDALHAAGFRLAVGSSGPKENVELVRQQLRSGQRLSAIVHGMEVEHGKPQPDVFLKAAEKLGLPPTRCAVIEDAPVGIEAARRAGMVAIALTGTADRSALSTRAHLVVDALSELTPHRIADLIGRG
jgi:beta-phosphoglucomutase